MMIDNNFFLDTHTFLKKIATDIIIPNIGKLSENEVSTKEDNSKVTSYDVIIENELIEYFKNIGFYNIISEESKFWKFITNNKFLDTNRISADVSRLENFYKNRGYYNAIIKSTSGIITDENQFELTFNINAGNKFIFNNVEVINNNDYPIESLAKFQDKFNDLKGKKYSKKVINSLVNDLNEFILKDIEKDKLYEFLRLMEFNRLLSSVISQYGEPKLKEKDAPSLKGKEISSVDRTKYKLINKLEDIDNWIKDAEEKGELCIDTETTSLDPHLAELVGISLSTDIGKACYIPLKHNGKDVLDANKVIQKIKPILEDKSIKKIGQNIKFDYIIFYHRGIIINSMEDTMLMSYVLDAGKNRHNMDTLSELHLGHKTISYKDLVGSGFDTSN